MGWKQKASRSLFSIAFLDEARSEIGSVRARLRCWSPANLMRIRALRKQKHLQLNLGAGPHERAGWHGMDLFPGKQGVRWDLRWGIPVRTGTVSKIHCEHFMDQLEQQDEAPAFLKECFRVLEPGGELRLIVTDASQYFTAYVEGDPKFWSDFRFLGGATKPFELESEVFNQAFRIRRFCYDIETLSLLLQKAGFEISVARFDPETYLDQIDWWRERESLYLTAKKKQTLLALPSVAA